MWNLLLGNYIICILKTEIYIFIFDLCYNRTECCMRAIRAQALKQDSEDDEMRLLKFCCCNDIIAPPIWCLLLTHCPSYLKQIWELSSEAKAVSISHVATLLCLTLLCLLFALFCSKTCYVLWNLIRNGNLKMILRVILKQKQRECPSVESPILLHL